jgi:leader peptidase (prepilin peptidase)/N-methyltransferase
MIGSDLVGALEPTSWALLVVAVFVGSFVGTLIRRLPDGRSIIWGRSRCELCGATLGIRDLLPLASWVNSKGRCRHCGARLDWFYPAVEALAIAIAGLSVAVDYGESAWRDAVLGWWLLALGWIDLRRWLLPDALTLPLIVAGLAQAWWLGPPELFDRVAGAACGYLVLRLVGLIYQYLRGRIGIGLGDAKLLAAAGAWVGIGGLPSVLAGAAIGALVAAGVLVLRGSKLGRYSALPLGPFLALATWVVWLFGPLPL